MSLMYYTVKELAEHWRCPCSVIYNLIKTGKLRAFKLGVSYRISEQAVSKCEKELGGI